MEYYLNKNTINIFSKDKCKYCSMIKEELEKFNIDKNIIDTSKLEKKIYDVLILELKEKTKQNTFPFVYINDNFYGGFSEINNMIRMGSLFEILDNNEIKYDKDALLF